MNSLAVKGRMPIQVANAGQSLCGQFSCERVYELKEKRWQINVFDTSFLFQKGRFDAIKQ